MADENILVTAAKKIGAAAGKVASLGKSEGANSAEKPKAAKGKLLKKHKSRLPRKVKKAQKKAAAKAAQSHG